MNKKELADYQTLYQKAIKFVATKHLNQTIPGTDLPYVVHLSNVAMEIMIASQNTENFNLAFALQIALLHDILEDTETSFRELSEQFGYEIAKAVKALTKDKLLPKEDRMTDSLKRIKELPKEVWAVKLADRITNLQEPPKHWNKAKRIAYRNEAIKILEALKGGNTYLEKRLSGKINEYKKYIQTTTKPIEP